MMRSSYEAFFIWLSAMPAIWSIWLCKWVNGTETCWGPEILASKGSNTCVINIDWAKKDCGKQNESHLVLVYRDTLKNNGRKYAKERNESLPPKVGELHIKYYTTLVKSFKKFSPTIRLWRKIKGQREEKRTSSSNKWHFVLVFPE